MNAPAFCPQCQEKNNLQYAGNHRCSSQECTQSHYRKLKRQGLCFIHREPTTLCFNRFSWAVVCQNSICHSAVPPLLFVMMYWSREYFSSAKKKKKSICVLQHLSIDEQIVKGWTEPQTLDPRTILASQMQYNYIDKDTQFYLSTASSRYPGH